jgi:multidrug resistance efflux pump
MKFTIIQILSALLISLFILAGCQKNTPEVVLTGNQVNQPDSSMDNGEMSIEGHLVPKAFATLSFAASGEVVEVLVQEGELVSAGQVIAHLGGKQQAEATLKTAELELLSAQQALQDLYDTQEAVENQAFFDLQTASQAEWDAQRKLDSITGDRLQNEIAGAEAQLVLAENQLESANDNYDEYKDEPEDNTTRAFYQVQLTEAQRAYNEAVQQLDDLQGEGYTFILQQAQDSLAAAETQRELSEKHYLDVSQGPDAGTLDVASARVSVAETNLATAQAILEHYDLRAPANGKLVESNLNVGELITMGQPVAKWADISEWYVETTDLTEIDIVNIEVGQAVEVIADAQPDERMNGTVTAIQDTFQEVRGDITYVTRIKLEDAVPGLRWGMTVLVNFLTQK